MNEHRLHQSWSCTSNIAARQRRLRVARRRAVRMRARLAELNAAAARNQLGDSEHPRSGDPVA